MDYQIDMCQVFTELIDELRQWFLLEENRIYQHRNKGFVQTPYGYLTYNKARVGFFNNRFERLAEFKRAHGALWLQIHEPCKLDNINYRRGEVLIDTKDSLTVLFTALTGLLYDPLSVSIFRSLK